MKPHRVPSRRHLPTSPFATPVATPVTVERYALRDQVSHDKYGLGVVVGVEAEQAVIVDFGTSQRRIVAPYAKLTKL